MPWSFLCWRAVCEANVCLSGALRPHPPGKSPAGARPKVGTMRPRAFSPRETSETLVACPGHIEGPGNPFGYRFARGARKFCNLKVAMPWEGMALVHITVNYTTTGQRVPVTSAKKYFSVLHSCTVNSRAWWGLLWSPDGDGWTPAG